MKKYTLALAVSAAILGSSAMAAAGPNHITFIGEVTDQTCQVAINGNDTNPVVLLPTVATTDFASAGDVAGETTFVMSVSGCDGTAVTAKTQFVGNAVDANGYMKNIAADGAENVALQLLAEGAAIDLNNSLPVAGPSVIAGETEGSAEYAVQYVATDADVTAGAVTGTVQFSITYL
ncbi:fimbrial protein [Vibrio metschnikovii]